MERYELLDGIGSALGKLEKAQVILGELTQEYFDKYDRDIQGDHLGIAWEFSRNATYAHIIFDYVIEAKKELAALEERAGKESAPALTESTL